MGRIVAIDFGQKRVGIAVTDTLQMIANGLTTVPTSKIFDFLKDYISKEPVDEFVVGLPKQMDYTESESMKYITPFVNGLKNNFPNQQIHMFDERFSSKLASKAIAQSGMSKKNRQDKGLIDQVSATIILQDYLESKRYL